MCSQRNLKLMAEQASQAEQRLAIGAGLAFGVLEGLVLVAPDVHDDRTNSAAAVLRDGGCTRDPKQEVVIPSNHLGTPHETHL